MHKRFWTGREISLLQRLYPQTEVKYLALRLKRPVIQVYHKAAKLGLKRLDNPGGRGTHGNSGSFRPGHIPLNKGTHIASGGRSIETRFRKGHRSANTLYDGAIVVRHDYDAKLNKRRLYKWIRLGGKWRMLHVVKWERAHGPVPAGSIVTFKDGNGMHCALSNLRCITRAEHIANIRKLDGYIAAQLSRGPGRVQIDREKYAAYRMMPNLLELKRKQFALERQIKKGDH